MYINWAHHYIPKISGFLAVFVNFFFMGILKNDKKNKLGDYRYLLIFFSLYNLSCTVVDLIIPMAVHDYRFAFSIFISDGWFEEKSFLGMALICYRCSFVPAAYGVLHSHFVYRYLVLFNNNFLTQYFMPYGLLLTISYCLFLMALWFSACWFWLYPDKERLDYLELTFLDYYDVKPSDLNILISLYQEGSEDVIMKSWLGIGIISLISVYSTYVYVYFGLKIADKLDNAQMSMSRRTRKLQNQLIKALVVQAVIPMYVSFLPCLVVWYLPVIQLDLGDWIHLTACVAFALFPVFDPLALFWFLPAFRRRIKDAVRSNIALISKFSVTHSSSTDKSR